MAETDLWRRVMATVVNHGIWDPRYQDITDLIADVGSVDPHPSLGAGMLDAVLALRSGLIGDPSTIAMAQRAVGNQLLLDFASQDATWLAGACEVLLAADQEEAMIALDAILARSHQAGSTAAVAFTRIVRGMGWLWRGYLADAEAELLESKRVADTVGLWTAPFIGAFLPSVLIEQGRLDEAAAILHAAEPDPIPPSGPWYFLLESKAQLLRVRGRHEDGIRAAIAAGRHFSAFQFNNPAFAGWRSEAALGLRALGRAVEARELAEEELQLARRWAAPRALGRALRITAMVSGGPTRRAMLEEAAQVLNKSPARLEYAKVLMELGKLLRRVGHRAAAKECLSQSIDLAHQCGAMLLIKNAEPELLATGARPRRPYLTGPQALTPSERRVVDLAIQGLTNRDIAQQLFVTVKTVEFHLSHAYRKRGISRRNQLRPLD
jgi:DNA-binding CsgD family transcriptional regulator